MNTCQMSIKIGILLYSVAAAPILGLPEKDEITTLGSSELI